MREYPVTPTGRNVSAGRAVGPFRKHVTWRRPDGGTVVLDLAAANGFTALGGLCFLVGAVLLLPEAAGRAPAAVAAR